MRRECDVRRPDVPAPNGSDCGTPRWRTTTGGRDSAGQLLPVPARRHNRGAQSSRGFPGFAGQPDTKFFRLHADRAAKESRHQMALVVGAGIAARGPVMLS